MDSGFNSSGSSFECVVAEKKSGKVKAKKAGLIIAYVLYVAACFVVGGMIRLFLPLLALVPISLWVIIFFTWRYTNVQYEYSFLAGDLTVSRVLNDRFRKELVKVHIHDMKSIRPYENVNMDTVLHSDDQVSIFAASAPDADGLWVAIWYDEQKNQKFCLYFEPDDKSLKILRYYNAAAFTTLL